LWIALKQPLEPGHQLPGDLVEPRLQLERFVEFVDLPTEGIVRREQLSMERNRAVRLPANTRRWHVFGIGIDAEGTGTLKTTLAGKESRPSGASHERPPGRAVRRDLRGL